MPRKGQLVSDHTGKRFGHLTVVRFTCRVGRAAQWHCRCDCGETVTVASSNLTGGNTRSCGCIRRETQAVVFTTHGHAGEKRSPEYQSWCAMHARCRAKTGDRERLWSGRGIRVCRQWGSFEQFLADVGPRPAGTSLDRYPNNDGNYEPGNVRWATRSQQNRNQRRNMKPKGSEPHAIGQSTAAE